MFRMKNVAQIRGIYWGEVSCKFTRIVGLENNTKLASKKKKTEKHGCPDGKL